MSVRFGPADSLTKEFGRSVRAAGLVLGLALTSLALLVGCGSKPATKQASPATMAARALTQFEQAVAERDATKLHPDLSFVADNAEALGIVDFSARWADEVRRTPRTFTGSVQVSYRLGGYDANETRTSVDMTFTKGDQTTITAIGDEAESTPLWLSQALGVRRSDNTLVLAVDEFAGADLDRISTQTVEALRLVGKVIADPGSLVVEIPGSASELDRLLSARPGEYADVAAVAATPDGSLVPGSPVHVFINPDVFMQMDRQGAQVVLTHEATHVVMGALFVDLPGWLREGFADYVAFAHAGVPVEVGAKAFLHDVRVNGLPSELPTDADLDPRAKGFATFYEASWLVCRTIAERFGEPSLVSFYRAVSDGADPDEAMRSVLGINEVGLLQLWRADLTALVG